MIPIIIVNETKNAIHHIILKERSRTVLAISGGASFRKGFFIWEQPSVAAQSQPGIACTAQRVSLDLGRGKDMEEAESLFQADGPLASTQYDMILVTDLFDDLPVEAALSILAKLLKKAKKQVLVIVPQLCAGKARGVNDGLQKYHPVVFSKFDFTYILLGRDHENKTQLYSFYPTRAPAQKTLAPALLGTGKPRSLRLAYILPDQDLTGGMKQLLLQMREMHRRGHTVYAYTKGGAATAVLPKWSDVLDSDIDGQWVVPPEEAYLSHLAPVDAIVLGWMKQVPEFRHAEVPVFLWEQGSGPLFGDFGKPVTSHSNELKAFRSYYQPPLHLMAVSPLVQTLLKARFGREAALVLAAVEPNATPPVEEPHKLKQILLVGSGEKDFKNFKFVIQALVLAAKQGAKFEAQWIAPTLPAKDMVPKGLRFVYHIAPTQEKLAALYKCCDLLLSHSLYEAFSLPPLEAMAAGTAVLATNSGGIETYAVSGENCLLCPQGDMAGFVKGIHTLLQDDALRARLAAAGLVTAGRFTTLAMCESVENAIAPYVE